MFDNNQVVNIDTKEITQAIQSLAGCFLTEKQLTKKKIEDREGDVHVICPAMITLIQPVSFYGPTRTGAKVHYISGESFRIDLEVDALTKQLEIN